MKITLNSKYHAVVDNNFLGYVGENHSRTITIENYQLDEADMYKIRLSYPSGIQYDIDISDGEIDTTVSMLWQAGNVSAQIIALKHDGDVYKYVKKSNIFSLEIKESLEGQPAVIPTYEQSIDTLEKVLSIGKDVEQCIEVSELAIEAKNDAEQAAAAAEASKDVALDAEGKATQAMESASQSADDAQKSADDAETSNIRAGISLSIVVDAMKNASEIRKETEDLQKELPIAIENAQSAAEQATQAANVADSAASTATAKADIATQAAQTASTAQAQAEKTLSSIPADYTELSNNVDELKSDLAQVTDTIYGKILYEKGYSVLENDGYIEEKIGYYNSKNGLFVNTDGSGYGDNWKTRIFSVRENTTYKWYAKNLIANSACAWLDSEQKTIEKFDVTSSMQYATVQTSVSPAGAVYFAIGASTKDATTEFMDLQYDENVYDGNGIYGTISSLEERVSIIEENIVIPDKTNPLSVIKETPGLLSCFLTVGCIGDSLASGEAVSNNGTVGYHDIYKHSWGQYLARRTGNTYYNWSQGGARTDSWLNSSFATKCYSGEYPCDAYIIGLGENDYTKCKNDGVSFAEFIGTLSDIDIDNYENNANTFIGRYAKIIQKIFEVQPKAKIFVICDPIEKFETYGFNQAIRDIANFFDDVYLMDLYTYGKDLYAEMRLESQIWRGGHGSAYFYYKASLIMATYIDWIMENNPAEFNQIEFIGTDWEWS